MEFLFPGCNTLYIYLITPTNEFIIKKMKISTKILLLFPLFINVFLFSQEIDEDLLSQLSPDQIEIAKSAFNKSNSSDVSSLDMPVLNESLKKIDLPNDSNRVAGKKFGYSFFSTMPTSTSAVGDLPLPNDYIISIRDQFTVILSGSKEGIFDLNVKLDGTILFPEIGSVSVVGETLGEVKQKLTNLINQTYIGVNLDLSIKNLSAKKITIVGAVKSPGTYLVNPFSTISSALAYSGGISEIGTLRNIKLIKNNGEIIEFDLYDLLIKGDRSSDLTIDSGDTILIGAASQFIDLSGSVNRPAIYEVKGSDKLDDLIMYGLGFSQTANKSNIALRSLNIAESSIIQTSTDSLDHSLRNVISVNVFAYKNKDRNNVLIRGAVAEPGFYEISENTSLSSMIEKLEFVDVYPFLATIEQYNEEELLTSKILFNLNDKSSYEDIMLQPDSYIYFSNINSREFAVDGLTQALINDYSLRIVHSGKNYILPVIGKFSVKSFIDLLGLDMTEVENDAIYVSPLENKISKMNYREMIFDASKFHVVTFRTPINDIINVKISGAIEFPGTYSLKAGSTIEDLYQLMGDIKDEAFLDGIIFKRESVRQTQLNALAKSKQDLNESILVNLQDGQNTIDPALIQALSINIEPRNLGRIAGNFRPNSKVSKSTVLYDADEVFIPVVPFTVSVIGEVMNPLSFTFEKKISPRDAIELAGGYKDYADKRNVYIIRANGLVEKIDRNIFAGNKKLYQGDTLVVPRMLDIKGDPLNIVSPITQIISNLAFSAAALDNLQSN